MFAEEARALELEYCKSIVKEQYPKLFDLIKERASQGFGTLIVEQNYPLKLSEINLLSVNINALRKTVESYGYSVEISIQDGGCYQSPMVLEEIRIHRVKAKISW